MKNNTSKKDRALQGLKQNFNDYSLLFIVLFLLFGSFLEATGISDHGHSIQILEIPVDSRFPRRNRSDPADPERRPGQRSQEMASFRIQDILPAF